VSRRPSDHQPAFDPIAERLVDIGKHLREARQQRGEDLYDVADYLRIKPSYLFALEEGDLAGMPGRTYAMGFLRTYADHLGYDGAEVVRQLKTTGEPEAEASLQVRQPVAENRLPSFGVIVMALLLAGVAYGGWFAAQSGDEMFARIKALPGDIGQYAATMFEEEPAGPMTAAINAPDDNADAAPFEALLASDDTPPPTTSPAERLASVASAPTGSSADPGTTGPIGGVQAGEVPSTTSSAGPPAGSIDITSAIAGRPSPAQPAPADIEDTVASLVLDAEAERAAALRRLDEERPDGGTVGELLAALQATPGDAAGGVANGVAPAPVTSDTGRITLLAREAAWIQVQSPARDYLRSTTLEPGQRFDIPDRTDLALWTGNAGGLEVWVDGQSVGVLGQSGAVLRDVSLTPEALLARR
jgi:cytoskeleton protein RodZ